MTVSHFKYAILGGGNAAGYAAREFVAQGVKAGELVIIGDEKVVAYERPALSKGFLFPENAARLPGFHTCVGGGGERQVPTWYEEKGIAYWTGAHVTHADLKGKKLSVADGRTVTYDNLIIATGAKPISLSGKVPGADLSGIHYLRNVEDALSLVEALKATKEKGGKAVMVGGGYIGMEVAAGVASNSVPTTIVMPEDRLMSRLFTPEMAEYYERFYSKKDITMLKGAKVVGFEGADGKVARVVVEVDGKQSKVDADLVVVGVGARPSSELFQGQLDMEAGGVKVDGHLQSSVPGVYAIGDVALFPLKMYGGTPARQEHVINARQTAAHAVKAIYGSTEPYDYVPSFYSRVFSLAWVFYGQNEGEAVHFGDRSETSTKFGVYWVKDSKVVGAFLEGGSADEAALMKKIATLRPEVPGTSAELVQLGVDFASKL